MIPRVIRTMSEQKRKSKSGRKILSDSDSDSVRSRSLSAGRTQGQGDEKRRATTPSKCKPNHSDLDSSDDFADSVSDRVRRRRRVRRIREKEANLKASKSKTRSNQSIDSVDEESKQTNVCSKPSTSQAATTNTESRQSEFQVAQIPPYLGPGRSSGAGQATAGHRGDGQ